MAEFPNAFTEAHVLIHESPGASGDAVPTGDEERRTAMKLSKPLLLCCALAAAFLAAAVAGPTGAIAAGSEDLTGPVVKIFDDRLSPATTHVAPPSAVTWVN